MYQLFPIDTVMVIYYIFGRHIRQVLRLYPFGGSAMANSPTNAQIVQIDFGIINAYLTSIKKTHNAIWACRTIYQTF